MKQPSADLLAYARKCEHSAGDWQKGVVDYPTHLSGKMNQGLTYRAFVDITKDPAPPAKLIPEADAAASQPVVVRCKLRARLVTVTSGTEVSSPGSDDAGWLYQKWSPSGVVEWAWTVKPTEPVEQKVRLEITPAVTGGPDAYGSQVTTAYETRIAVSGTVLEHIKYWFDTQWPLLTGMAVIVGGAILAVLAWSKRFRKELKGTDPPSQGGQGDPVSQPVNTTPSATTSDSSSNT